MIVFRLFICFVLLFFVPMLIGYGYLEKFTWIEKSVSTCIVFGTIVMWAIFMGLCIPAIWFGKSFMMLAFVYTLVCFTLCVWNSCMYKEMYKDLFKSFMRFWFRKDLLIYLVLVCVAILFFAQIGFMHEDADDAEFVTIATTTIQTDSLLEYDAFTGNLDLSSLMKRVVAPFSIMLAYYAKLTGFHAAIFCHTVFPSIVLLIAFLAYYCVARILFQDDQRKISFFLILMCTYLLFSGYSAFSLGERLILRPWQGKSVLMALCLPMVFILLWKLMEEKIDLKRWLGMAIFIIGCSLTSSMANILLPIIIGCFALANLWKKRSWAQALALLSTCFPCVIFVGIYLLG